MKKYTTSPEETKFLEQYDISQFARPSLAADMALFSIMEQYEPDNFRKLPQNALKILLIKRAGHPYKDYWALPGGFCRPGEDVYETAMRELQEETGVENAYLKLVGTYGEMGRDPRGWIISNTFLALIDGEKYRLHAGTDAWEARWFSIDLKQQEICKTTTEEFVEIETEYTIHLQNEETGCVLEAHIKEYKQHKNYHETVKYEIMEDMENMEDDGIAFDHAKIILSAILNLRNSVENDLKLVFDLMPEMFTLTQLQKAMELVLGQKLLTANFRRKIADYVVETEHSAEGAGHRPAKLFKRNVEKFYR